jgi:hypothetical protein
VGLDLELILFKPRPFLPINTQYLPINFSFDFPSLPKSEEEGLVGTCEWKRVLLEISGRAGMVKVEGTTGDGIHYPRLEHGPYWLWVKDARIRIEGAQVWSSRSSLYCINQLRPPFVAHGKEHVSLNYHYDNGRRYHAYHSGAYWYAMRNLDKSLKSEVLIGAQMTSVQWITLI